MIGVKWQEFLYLKWHFPKAITISTSQELMKTTHPQLIQQNIEPRDDDLPHCPATWCSSQPVISLE